MKITPLTAAAAAAFRVAITTRTRPATAAAPAAGPIQTGRDPARDEPSEGSANIAVADLARLPVARAKATGTVAVPAAGHSVRGRRQGRSAGTGSGCDGTTCTGTGFCAGSGRKCAGLAAGGADGGAPGSAAIAGTSSSAIPATPVRRTDRMLRLAAAAIGIQLMGLALSRGPPRERPAGM